MRFDTVWGGVHTVWGVACTRSALKVHLAVALWELCNVTAPKVCENAFVSRWFYRSVGYKGFFGAGFRVVT